MARGADGIDEGREADEAVAAKGLLVLLVEADEEGIEGGREEGGGGVCRRLAAGNGGFIVDEDCNCVVVDALAAGIMRELPCGCTVRLLGPEGSGGIA